MHAYRVMGCERRHFLFFGNIWLCPFLWFPFVIVTQNYVQYMKVVIVCRWCEWVHLINETIVKFNAFLRVLIAAQMRARVQCSF